jgi:hypothetical protein
MNDRLGGRFSVFTMVVLLLACVMASAATGRAADPSGEVGFGTVPTPGGPDQFQRERVVLSGYTGSAMTALQFTIVCEWPYRLAGVGRGERTADSTIWRLYSEMRPGKGTRAGADTVRVILLSTSLAGITASEVSGLLSLTIRRPVSPSATAEGAYLRITEVIGALPTGDNAHLTTGPPLKLSHRIP